MSYTELTNATSFTSNAGEATEAKVAEIISSFSADLFAFCNETEEEKKASILSKYPSYLQDDMKLAVDMSCALGDAEEADELVEALNDIVSISSGYGIDFYANSENHDIELFWCAVSSLLSLMEGKNTQVHYTCADSRDGISTDVAVLYKDGSVKSLDEVLAAA